MSLRRAFSALSTTMPSEALVNGVNRHVVAALVANQPNTVAEITNLICARGYNVDSLVVGRTNVPQLVRLSVVVHGTDHHAHMMKQQLHDVVQVAAVKVLTAPQANTVVERDLVLAKVSVKSPEARSEIDIVLALFDATIVDESSSSQLMVQMAGQPTRLEEFLDMLHPFGIVEVHRSGVVAMDRDELVTDHTVHVDFDYHSHEDMNHVDSTRLPPG